MNEEQSTVPHSPVPPSQPAEQTSRFIAAVFKTPEAAAYLDVKPATLEQWRWNGRGPRFCKIGRSCRYRQADLDAFLSERVFSSTTEAQAAA